MLWDVSRLSIWLRSYSSQTGTLWMQSQFFSGLYKEDERLKEAKNNDAVWEHRRELLGFCALLWRRQSTPRLWSAQRGGAQRRLCVAAPLQRVIWRKSVLNRSKKEVF